jgi:hypothetical protein
VTLRAGFIQASHRQPTRWLEDIEAMRIMTLNTAHVFFQHGMMLGQVEFRFGGSMTLETGAWILPGVHNELARTAAACDMEASRAMAGFAAALTSGARGFEPDPCVGAGRERARDIRMTLRTGLVPHKVGTRDLRGGQETNRNRGARLEPDRNGSQRNTRKPGYGEASRLHVGRWLVAAGLTVSLEPTRGREETHWPSREPTARTSLTIPLALKACTGAPGSPGIASAWEPAPHKLHHNTAPQTPGENNLMNLFKTVPPRPAVTGSVATG